MKRSARWTRLTQWEHWPTSVFYVPLLPLFFLRFLKEGHPNHFLTANPGIKYSGNGSESKFKTLNLMSEKYRPKGFLVFPSDRLNSAKDKMAELKISYPIIVKPDRGFRGYLVKKIESEEDLGRYLERISATVLIQEFVPFEKELGVFYHRYPKEEKGQITSVTIKRFLKIIGDGSKSLEQLIEEDQRAFLYSKLFKLIHKEGILRVPEKGEEIILSVIGNHSKGTQFINGNHLIDEKLVDLMDRICKPMQGFYYGRLDIKYKDFESLLKGKDFKILEVNGIISEPTHIYDASHQEASFVGALKAINHHWKIMSEIAHINHHKNKVPYPGIGESIKSLIWLRKHSKMLKKLNSKDL